MKVRLEIVAGIVIITVWSWFAPVTAQGSLSAQVLRLLSTANTWTAAQTFSVNIQLSAVNTSAPAGTDCDAAGETGKVYWDSTNDNLYICSGASGWRKVATTAP